MWKIDWKRVFRPTVASMAAKIARASRAGQWPDINQQDHARMARAVDALLNAGNARAAELGARALLRLSPRDRYARSLCELFDLAPEANEDSPFADDLTKDVQVVRREGADVVIFAFCGLSHRLGMPLTIAHRWLGRLPAHVVYLRDFHKSFYLQGIASLGPTREATVQALRQLALSLPARRIACFGNSGGAFASLLYGLDVGAKRVVGLAGPTNLSPQFNTHLRLADLTRTLASAGNDVEIDLRRAYREATAPPKALLSFGGENWDDRIQAEYLSGLPSVTLAPIAGVRDHIIAVALARMGKLSQTLQWLVDDGE